MSLAYRVFIILSSNRIHLRWGCREILYDKSADGETYVTGLAISKVKFSFRRRILVDCENVYIHSEGCSFWVEKKHKTLI